MFHEQTDTSMYEATLETNRGDVVRIHEDKTGPLLYVRQAGHGGLWVDLKRTDLKIIARGDQVRGKDFEISDVGVLGKKVTVGMPSEKQEVMLSVPDVRELIEVARSAERWVIDHYAAIV